MIPRNNPCGVWLTNRVGAGKHEGYGKELGPAGLTPKKHLTGVGRRVRHPSCMEKGLRERIFSFADKEGGKT